LSEERAKPPVTIPQPKGAGVGVSFSLWHAAESEIVYLTLSLDAARSPEKINSVRIEGHSGTEKRHFDWLLAMQRIKVIV
jgi:hypothetical protein